MISLVANAVQMDFVRVELEWDHDEDASESVRSTFTNYPPDMNKNMQGDRTPRPVVVAMDQIAREDGSVDVVKSTTRDKAFRKCLPRTTIYTMLPQEEEFILNAAAAFEADDPMDYTWEDLAGCPRAQTKTKLEKSSDWRSKSANSVRASPTHNPVGDAPSLTEFSVILPSDQQGAQGIPLYSFESSTDVTNEDIDNTDADVDAFVRGLVDQRLTLASAVQYQSGRAFTNQPLSHNDNTWRWLHSFVSSFQFMEISVSGVMTVDEANMPAAKISSLRMQCQFGTTRDLLIFDSTAVASGFNLAGTGADLTKQLGSTGFLTHGTGCMFGAIPPSNDLAFTLSDFCALVGLNASTDLKFLSPATALTGYWSKGQFKNPQASTFANMPAPANGIWYCPEGNNRVTLVICAQSASTAAAGGKLLGLTETIPFVDFENCSLIGSKQGMYSATAATSGPNAHGGNGTYTGSLCIQCTATLKDKTGKPYGESCQSWLVITSSTFDLTLQWSGSSVLTLGSIIQWVLDASGIKVTDYSEYENTMLTFFQNIKLRQLKIGIAKDANNKWILLPSFSITLEADLQKSTFGNENPVPISLTFEYDKSYVGFTGSIWNQYDAVYAPYDRLNSDSPYQPRLIPLASNPQYYVDLTTVSQRMKEMPEVIPPLITALSCTLSTTQLSFEGVMSRAQSSDAGPTSLPWLSFDSIEINASYQTGTKELEFGFDAVISIQTRDPQPYTYSGLMMIDIDYATTGGWAFAGYIEDLNGACLYSFLPPGKRDAIMNVVEDIVLSNFSVNYKYSSATQSSIQATGNLALGPLILDLNFSSDLTKWEFEGSLSLTYPVLSYSLGDLLTGLWADIADELPDFILSTVVTLQDQSSRPANSAPLVKVTCEECTDPVLLGVMLLSVTVQAQGFEFSYAQMSPSSTTTKQPAKRLFRFEMETLPLVSDIPLLESLTQPFDQMDFIWTSDNFNVAEVAFLNATIFNSGQDALICKAPTQPSTDPAKKPFDTVLFKGSHFLVIAEESGQPTVVLDHCFSASSAEIPSSQAVAVLPGKVDPVAEAPPVVTAPPATSSTAPWQKKIYPLTISAISMQYQDQKLQITLAAVLKVAGVEVDLKGFGIRFPLNMKNASQFSVDDIDILLQGLGIELQRPPLTIAGDFERVDNGFAGGIAIEFEPYTFVAAGAYIKGPDYKSIMILLSVAGPIAELEFASLSGLTGGYGYNSQMRLPSVDQVLQHPFLDTSQITSAGGDIVATFQKLIGGPDPWFKATKGPQWIAAGLDVDAFQILNIDAVFVIDLSADVILALFADCKAQIPEEATNDSERFASVEMGLLAVLDYAKGSLTVQGQLNPRSFILDQQCHLSGGFALCYWFGGSGHEGDWVMTVGGYHPSYVPPTWYPVPPRLAISWQYDPSISINGDAYFAITPKVAMGGGKLNLMYLDGTLGANLTAWADFLINFRPFSFTASIGITVDAHYTFTHWGLVKQFDAHFGCSLDMWGPPVAGNAHIDWCIMSFDVHFGAPPAPAPALTWIQFHDMLLQSPGSKGTGSGSGSTLLTLSPTSALIDPKSLLPPPATGVWAVSGSTFQFRCTSLFPIMTVQSANKTVLYTSPNARPFMKPMRINVNNNVTSSLTVQIIEDTSGADTSSLFTLTAITKLVPAAVWSPCMSSLLCVLSPFSLQLHQPKLTQPNRRPSNRPLQHKLHKQQHPPLPRKCNNPPGDGPGHRPRKTDPQSGRHRPRYCPRQLIPRPYSSSRLPLRSQHPHHVPRSEGWRGPIH